MSQATTTTMREDIRVDLPALVKLFSERLYTREAALVLFRELLQNAYNASRAARTTEAIQVRVDGERRILEIRDHGCGLTANQVRRYLATVAASGWGKQDHEGPANGQAFGVGLLSTLAIAERLEVLGLVREPGASLVRFAIDKGAKDFELEKLPPGETSPGVTVRLHLPDKRIAAPLLDLDGLRRLVREHADLVPHPIQVGSCSSPVNCVERPWDRPGCEGEDLEPWLANRSLVDRDRPPLLVVPLPTELGVGGALWLPAVPGQRSTCRLWVGGFFVQERDDLLPWGLGFFAGLIATRALTVSVDRERVIDDARLTALGKTVTRRLLQALKELSQRRPGTARRVVDEYGNALKKAAAEHRVVLSSIGHMLELSLLSHQRMSLGDIEDLAAGGRQVFFIDDPSQGHLGRLLLNRRDDVIVVDATSRLDYGVLRAWCRLHDLSLKRVDQLSQDSFEKAHDFARLEDLFAAVLPEGTKPQAVHIDGTVPVLLSARDSATMDSQIRTMMKVVPQSDVRFLSKMLEQLRAQAGPRVAFIDVEHPIVRRLEQTCHGDESLELARVVARALAAVGLGYVDEHLDPSERKGVVDDVVAALDILLQHRSTA